MLAKGSEALAFTATTRSVRTNESKCEPLILYDKVAYLCPALTEMVVKKVSNARTSTMLTVSVCCHDYFVISCTRASFTRCMTGLGGEDGKSRNGLCHSKYAIVPYLQVRNVEESYYHFT